MIFFSLQSIGPTARREKNGHGRQKAFHEGVVHANTSKH
jgi:hypothetical protein